MYLAIDIGNTRTKFCIFTPDGEPKEVYNRPEPNLGLVSELFCRHDISHTILSSVGSVEEDGLLLQDLQKRCKTLILNHSTPLPIRLRYQTAQTLGADRIAAACAAHALFPNRHTLVFQAGTCLVSDFVTAEGDYLGGAIAPGLQMRYQALNFFAHRLPVPVTPTNWPDAIGTTTDESIRVGVLYGMADEINGTISRYKEQFGEIEVILTGGDKNVFEKSIKNTIFAAHNLVLTGLIKILTFNVKEHNL